MLHTLYSFIDTHSLIPRGSRIIIGLSGGPDSLFLLHLLASMRETHNLEIIAAHLDHEWRVNSHKDVEFCQQQCDQLGILFIARRASELGLIVKLDGSKEALGRTLRRHFLEQVKKEHTADLIALAHHAQDQQETFFIRLLRGASLSGLTGMKLKNGPYIRPLLQTNKSDILAYLESNQISYWLDPTNDSDLFLRNRIRNHVLPAFQAIDNRFDQNFTKTLNRLAQTNDFIELLSRQAFDKLTICEENKIRLNINGFLEESDIIQRTVLIQFLCSAGVPFTPSDALLDEMMRFFKLPGDKSHTINPAWSLEKKKQCVRIIKREQ
jgi:tRNA(Ile)-lysidine synthase